MGVEYDDLLATLDELRDDLTKYASMMEDRVAAAEEEADDAVAEGESRFRDIWDEVSALHHEAHGPRWPIGLCSEHTCIAIVRAVRPDWRTSLALTG